MKLYAWIAMLVAMASICLAIIGPENVSATDVDFYPTVWGNDYYDNNNPPSYMWCNFSDDIEGNEAWSENTDYTIYPTIVLYNYQPTGQASMAYTINYYYITRFNVKIFKSTDGGTLNAAPGYSDSYDDASYTFVNPGYNSWISAEITLTIGTFQAPLWYFWNPVTITVIYYLAGTP